MSAGQGVILVAGHLGNWELGMAYIAARGIKVTGTPEDFARYVAADFKRSEALLKAADFKPM